MLTLGTMNVTLDTNVFGPIAAPEEYPTYPKMDALRALRELILRRVISAHVSEASLSVEALSHGVRIDEFFREWAHKSMGIILPHPSPQRMRILDNALSMGLRVLRVPRIALHAFVDVPEGSWAEDTKFDVGERQRRHCQFVRDFSDLGLSKLKELGAALVIAHGLDTSNILQFPNWPPPEELVWMKGIIAEYDNPIRFPTRKSFERHVRNIIAEWCDLDILASHYAYGVDFCCTCDKARSIRKRGIFHTLRRQHLESKYGITIVSPTELVQIAESQK